MSTAELKVTIDRCQTTFKVHSTLAELSAMRLELIFTVRKFSAKLRRTYISVLYCYYELYPSIPRACVTFGESWN